MVFISGTLGTKRLELLRQFVPKATTIAVLVQTNNVETEAERKEVQAAAQSLGLHLVIAEARNGQEIDAAFATFIQRGVGALFVGAGPFFSRDGRTPRSGRSPCHSSDVFPAQISYWPEG